MLCAMMHSSNIVTAYLMYKHKHFPLLHESASDSKYSSDLVLSVIHDASKLVFPFHECWMTLYSTFHINAIHC